ncbi:hypothetical protein LUZ60_009831 [Juncus effusus]|nr:hypothetical protein LUZ60_009831 [Juncus effusus]
MAAPEQFIGNQVSLISKIDIRYEGTLAEVDLVTSKLKLVNVRSFGTEGRKTDGPQIPPMDNIYESVIFNGNDIKALNFVYNDPAIIQSQVQNQNQSSPVVNINPPYTSSTQPQITNLPLFNPSLSSTFQRPPQFTDLLLYHQPSSLSTAGLTITSSSQNTQQIPVLPLYQKPNLTVSIPDSSLTIGGQHIPNLPLYQPYLSTSSADSAPPAQITNFPSNFLSSYPTNPQPPPVHPFSAGTTTSTITGTVPLQTSLKPETNPNPNSNPSSTESDEYEIERQVRTGTNRSRNGPLLPNPSRNKPILSLPNRANNSQSNWKTGPVQYGRSASSNQHYNRGRGRAGMAYNNHNQFGGGGNRGRGKVVKFTEEFDFEAMNEKFNKDEVWGQLGRSHKEDGNNNDDDDYDSNDDDDVSYDEANYHSDNQSDAIKLAYKKDDFFDSLSGSQKGGPKFSEQIKLDTETFGHVPRYRSGGCGFRGGRSHYNRGGRYYHNNNNGYNNYNCNPNSETNPNRNRNRNKRGGYYVRRED